MSSHSPVPTVRVGFLGAGSWARQNHLPALRWIQEHESDRVRPVLAALCERDPALAQSVRAEYGFQRVHGRLEDFAGDDAVDCFVVVVRPAALSAVVRALVGRGLPIMTEKPPGLDGESAAELARLVRLPNVVGFNRRYFPIHERFAQLLSSMRDLYYMRACMFRNERYDGMPGTGLDPFVTGTGVHLINVVEHFFGSIQAARSSTVEVSSNGTRGWLADLRFRSGLTGRMELLPCTGSHSERIEVHGRSTSAYLFGCQYGSLEPPGWIEIQRDGRERVRIDGDPKLPGVVAAGFVGEYLDFFRAVTTGSPTVSSFASSVGTMRVAEAIEGGLSYTAREEEG